VKFLNLLEKAIGTTKLQKVRIKVDPMWSEKLGIINSPYYEGYVLQECGGSPTEFKVFIINTPTGINPIQTVSKSNLEPVEDENVQEVGKATKINSSRLSTFKKHLVEKLKELGKDLESADVQQAIYKALCDIWINKEHPTFFKYKWLVPLSKLKGPGSPTLSQLRPIMLIEALRKLWVSLLIKRIKFVLEEQQALSNNQFGFRQHRSTTEPLLQFTAILEQTAEVGGSLSGSTWDVVRAFDSVAKTLLALTMERIGIPSSVSEWNTFLIDQDQDSRIIVRTPWAECWNRREGINRIRPQQEG
jgi:hypothetical protein